MARRRLRYVILVIVIVMSIDSLEVQLMRGACDHLASQACVCRIAVSFDQSA